MRVCVFGARDTYLSACAETRLPVGPLEPKGLFEVESLGYAGRLDILAASQTHGGGSRRRALHAQMRIVLGRGR